MGDAMVAPRSLTVPRSMNHRGSVETALSNPNHTPIEVQIRIASDDDAARIAAVLEALGYKVVRELQEGEGSSRLEWAIDQLTRRYGLTEREREVLAGVLDGRSNVDIAKGFEVSRATIKWHMHNVFGKTKTSNREALLRLALQLGPTSRDADPPRPAPSDEPSDAD